MNRLRIAFALGIVVTLCGMVCSCTTTLQKRKGHIEAFRDYLLTHPIDSNIMKQGFFSQRIKSRYQDTAGVNHVVGVSALMKEVFQKGALSIQEQDGYDDEWNENTYLFILEGPEEFRVRCWVLEDGIAHMNMDGPKALILF